MPSFETYCLFPTGFQGCLSLGGFIGAHTKTKSSRCATWTAQFLAFLATEPGPCIVWAVLVAYVLCAKPR